MVLVAKGWKDFNGTQGDWDTLCLKYNANYRSLYGWGEYQSLQGWKVKRFIFEAETEEFAVQILYKSFFIFNAIYIPGGVIGSQSGFCQNLKDLLGTYFKGKIIYVRLDSSYKFNTIHHTNFINQKWSRPLNSLNSRNMLSIKLSNDSDHVFPESSRRFKKNIRESYNKNSTLEVGFLCTNQEIEDTSEAMQEYKHISLRDDPKNIVKIINFLKERIVFVCSRNNKGTIDAFRCALVFRNKAWDFYAATTEDGRKKAVGYCLLDKLVRECRERGVNEYYLPISLTNHGDTEFKVRTGGEHEEYMGEYEYSNIYILKYLLNLIVYLRFNFTSLSFLIK